jgi:hypothetical protein
VFGRDWRTWIRRLVVAGASDPDDDVAALGVGVDDAVRLCAHPMT